MAYGTLIPVGGTILGLSIPNVRIRAVNNTGGARSRGDVVHLNLTFTNGSSTFLTSLTQTIQGGDIDSVFADFRIGPSVTATAGYDIVGVLAEDIADTKEGWVYIRGTNIDALIEDNGAVQLTDGFTASGRRSTTAYAFEIGTGPNKCHAILLEDGPALAAGNALAKVIFDGVYGFGAAV